MNGIKHTRVAPYHPASSGATERCVQTVKQGLRKHSARIHISKERWLVNFLLRYRCTPHSVTGASPAEPFLKRYRCTPHSVTGASPAELFLKRYRCTPHAVTGASPAELFLKRYRCPPHSVTGASPAELFLKRRLRNRFSLLKPHKNMKEKQTWQHDRSGIKLCELVKGDSSCV